MEQAIHPRDVLISKFKDGKERYNTSVLFRGVVESILQGADPIELLGKLITMNEDNESRMLEYIAKGPAPIVIASQCVCNKKARY